MIQYRIVRRSGGFVCQWKGWFFWHSMFLGAWSDLPEEFPSVAEAEAAIRAAHAEHVADDGEVMKVLILS